MITSSAVRCNQKSRGENWVRTLVHQMKIRRNKRIHALLLERGSCVVRHYAFMTLEGEGNNSYHRSNIRRVFDATPVSHGRGPLCSRNCEN